MSMETETTDVCRSQKREMPEELEPVLVRVAEDDTVTREIRINKDEFRIGRGRDNDEIILNTMISRSHCLLQCDSEKEWRVTNLSSSCTLLNDVPLPRGVPFRIRDGDSVQFSPSEEFKYKFALVPKNDCKRPRLEEDVFDSIVSRQRTFVESQALERKEFEDKLESKHKEQEELKVQLEKLLKDQRESENQKDDLNKQILELKGSIEAGATAEQILATANQELCERLEKERLEFEAQLNKEKRQLQEALEESRSEKEALKHNMKEEMESWRLAQQTEWRKMMADLEEEKRVVQTRLQEEKQMLEQKLRATEEALRERESTEIAHENVIELTHDQGGNAFIIEVVDPSNLQLLDTIDLTGETQVQPVNKYCAQENVLDKVSDIMDEQLTCNICSELFVTATTLNCTHTFCRHCIDSWRKKKPECPVCRSRIMTMTRSLVLDNFIEKMVDNLSNEHKARRKEIVDERRALERHAKGRRVKVAKVRHT